MQLRIGSIYNATFLTSSAWTRFSPSSTKHPDLVPSSARPCRLPGICLDGQGLFLCCIARVIALADSHSSAYRDTCLLPFPRGCAALAATIGLSMVKWAVGSYVMEQMRI